MVGIARPVTKWCTLVRDVRDLPRAIHEAFAMDSCCKFHLVVVFRKDHFKQGRRRQMAGWRGPRGCRRP